MNPLRRIIAPLVACVLTAAVPAAESAVPFRSLSFDAAVKAAGAEGKLVFIDFYTVWCAPCKLLDEQTWTDAAVGKLLGEKAVPLKLDAEKEGRAAAARYDVSAYPTLLLLKPDGTEVDRLVGFREPATFISEFNSALDGKPSIIRAAEAVSVAANGRDAVKARYDFAKELARKGRAAEALPELLWCFDEGMVRESSFAGVRLSFLLLEIQRLAEKYPPAKEALRERRDAAERDLMANENLRRAAPEFAALNERLGDDARTLEVFGQLPAGDARRMAMGYSLLKLLVKAKRYADALEVKPYARIIRQHQDYVAYAKRQDQPAMQESNRGLVISDGADGVEILAGAGDLEHARDLAERLIAFDPAESTRILLQARAERAGQADLLKDL